MLSGEITFERVPSLLLFFKFSTVLQSTRAFTRPEHTLRKELVPQPSSILRKDETPEVTRVPLDCRTGSLVQADYYGYPRKTD